MSSTSSSRTSTELRSSCDLSIPLPIVALPCGSRSTSKTRRLVAASEAARFTAVVVLPTPPFWFAMAMTRFMVTVYCTVAREPSNGRHEPVAVACDLYRVASVTLWRRDYGLLRRDTSGPQRGRLAAPPRRPPSRASGDHFPRRGPDPFLRHFVGDGVGRTTLTAGALEYLRQPGWDSLNLGRHLGLGTAVVFARDTDDPTSVD